MRLQTVYPNMRSAVRKCLAPYVLEMGTPWMQRLFGVTLKEKTPFQFGKGILL
jgi:hypothetical protein